MNQQVKYMLWTYESFIIHSLIINFIIQPSPSNKTHHKQTCNRATLRSFSVKNSCSNEKRQIPRQKKDEFRKKDSFRGEIPRLKFRGSNFAAQNSAAQIPRPKIPRHTAGARKTVGPTRNAATKTTTVALLLYQLHGLALHLQIG